MRINYNPIKNLKKLIMNLPGSNASEDKEIKKYGEIEAVGAIVSNLAINNRLLTDRLDYSKDSVKIMLLVKLLKGHFNNKESFNEAAKDSGIRLIKTYFAAAVFQSSRGNVAMDKISAEINKVVRSSSSYDLEIIAVETMDQTQYHFIIGLNQDNPRYLENSLEALFFEETSLVGCLGLGELSGNTDYLFQSFFQASTALEYRFIRGNNQVISFREINMSNSRSFTDYPQEDLELFKAAIISRNTKNYEDSLDRLLNYFVSGKTDLFTARCIFYDIVNSLFKTSHSLGLSLETITSAHPDVMKLKELETANDFTELIKSVAAIIQQRIEEINNQINSRSIASVLEYVDQHVLEPNFSVQLLCDRFDISLSNLSHQFKRQTGMNISEYIGNLRIEYVKSQLRETDLPLKDIILNIGYSDASGFIRKFKQIVGMTPGEYKNACRLEEFK